MKKLLMALALLPLMAAAETWYDSKTGYTWTYSLTSVYGGWGKGCEWFVIGNDSVVLEAVSPIPNGELRIPSQINGHSVEVLGRYFMEEVDTIKRVVFPASMRYVCNGVFDDCPNLTEVVLNDGFLGGPRYYKTFGNCAVSRWELPASMRYMNFAKNPVDSITIRGGNNNCYCVKNGILLHSSQGNEIYDELCRVPRKVTAFEVGEEIRLIDQYAFYCNEMLSCDLSNTKVVCLREAFNSCRNLKSVKFPASLQEIDGIPFEHCNLDWVTFDGAVPRVWDEFNPPDVSDGWYRCLYAADDHYRKINGNIVTYVLPNKGWDDVVATGTWQGRPIRYVSDGPIQEIFLPGEAVSVDTGFIGYTAKGLPSGLKYDKKTGRITGAAKKPTAAEGVTVKFTKKGEADVTMTVVVGPIPTISVTLEGDTEKCKVTGANKAYLVGKKVILQAKGPKGTAFVGWFKDGEPWPNVEESKNAKLSYVMTKESISLVATFEKEKMSVACPGLASASFTVGVAGGAEGMPIEIETQSGVKSVAVSKLPTGMKYDKKTGLIVGAPTKAGSFDVTIKVTAKSGAVETLVVPVTVAALPDWAVGTFVGLVRQVDYDAQGNVVVDGDGRHDWYDVEIVVTVSVKGKISGKLKFPGNSGTGSFSAAAFSSCCEDGCVATGILKLGKNKGTVGLRVAPRALTARGSDLVGDVEVFCRGTASRTGYLITGSTDESHPLRQQIWKSKTLPLPPSIDKKSVAIERDGHLYTLSFGKSGAVDDTLASADNPKKVVKKGKPVFSVIGYWDSAWHCELFGTPIIDTTEGGGERIRFDVCIAHDGSLCCTPAE